MAADRMPDHERERRRVIVRKARLLTAGFFVMAVVVAVAGGALVAWLLSLGGLPFLETWIVVTVLLLLVPVIGLLVGSRRERDKTQRP